MPMPRPRRGPAIHADQPPLRPGTYREGPDAAPALIMKTLATIASSPSAPSPPATPPDQRMPPSEPARAVRAPAIGAVDMGVAARMEPIVTSPRDASVQSYR
jgi:hypothetical protein